MCTTTFSGVSNFSVIGIGGTVGVDGGISRLLIFTSTTADSVCCLLFDKGLQECLQDVAVLTQLGNNTSRDVQSFVTALLRSHGVKPNRLVVPACCLWRHKLART